MGAMNDISTESAGGSMSNLTDKLREFVNFFVQSLMQVLKAYIDDTVEKLSKEIRGKNTNSIERTEIQLNDDEFADIRNDFFPNVQPKDVIGKLILLANELVNGKFTINNDSHWFVIYKSLNSLGKIRLNMKRFVDIVQRYVVPHIKDAEHRQRISCKYSNLKTIRKEHPYRAMPCASWKTAAGLHPEHPAYKTAAALWMRIIKLF